MLREIIRPTSENYNIHTPKEYINTNVEILVLPLDNSNDKIINKKDSDIKAFSNHSANTIEEWRDDSEDEIWT